MRRRVSAEASNVYNHFENAGIVVRCGAPEGKATGRNLSTRDFDGSSRGRQELFSLFFFV